MEVQLEFPDSPSAVRSFVLVPPMSDAELECFCQRNDVFRIERTREGKIIIMTPAGMQSSGGNFYLGIQFGKWWETHETGYAFDSSGGFYLPDGSMLSPDVSYITAETLAKVPENRRDKFPYICPDFVIELTSPSDTFTATKKKMMRWIENGVQLGWLIHPKKRQMFVYTASDKAPVLVTRGVVEGIGPVQGFQLNLDEFWRRYA